MKDAYIHIRVSSEDKEIIKAAAEKDGRTVANYIIKVCKAHIAKEGK